MGARATRVGGFVDGEGLGEGLVVFGVGVVVDVKASPILPIAINTADRIGGVLMSGDCFVMVVVVDVIEGVVCVVVVVVVVDFVDVIGSCSVELWVFVVWCLYYTPYLTLYDFLEGWLKPQSILFQHF